jgi:hypothetical protein
MKYVYSPQRSALRQKIAKETEELYDLRADPQERENLAASGHPRLEQLRHKARRWVEGPRPAPAPKVEFDQRTVERLRALGYLAPAPAGAPDHHDAPAASAGVKPAAAPAAPAATAPAAAAPAAAPPKPAPPAVPTPATPPTPGKPAALQPPSGMSPPPAAPG